MAYPVGSSLPLAIGDRVDEPDPGPAAPVWLPLSTADGPAGDAASLVRSVLDDRLLDEFVVVACLDVARVSVGGLSSLEGSRRHGARGGHYALIGRLTTDPRQ